MNDKRTCRHCGRPIVLEDDVWVDPEATGDDSVWRETCDAHDTFIANHEPFVLDWENVVGSPSGNYVQAEYKGMHCELFYNNRLGSAPMAWDWSFYDDKSDDPELAVARSDEGFPTKGAAEEDLIDYIDGYEPSPH